ncbi:MAG: exo-alpha-sialidase [Candidatus Zixiibacteriota bacterium]|nr:MAG: exo-alpha-sialidase [candidate division Zixibacteria bacterium]
MKKIIFVVALLLPVTLAFGRVTITMDGGITGLTSNAVIDINHTSDAIWLGTGSGASVSFDNGDTWATFGAESGLPGEEVSALAANDVAIWVANSHSETVSGEDVPYGDGISFSTDDGQTWASFRPFAYLFPGYSGSPGMLSYDLAVHDSIVYSASFYGGLIRSTDFGESWENLFPSQLEETNTDSIDFVDRNYYSLNNRMFSVTVDTGGFPDTLNIWAGSAVGINRFSFPGTGGVYDTYPADIVRAFKIDAGFVWDQYDWHKDTVMADFFIGVSGGSETEDNEDWLYSPVINFSNATACTLFFEHYYFDGDSIGEDSALVLISDDGGNVWAETLAVFTDSAFGDTTAADSQWIDISSFAAGKSSIMVAFLYLKNIYELTEGAGSWMLNDITFLADGEILLMEDFEGDWGPYGNIPPSGWIILDDDYDHQLAGNFVVAIDVQQFQDTRIIWAACRPAFSGDLRVSFSYDDGRTWNTANITDRFGSEAIEAWDFSFAEDTVYVASSNGLFWSEGDYSEWNYFSGFIDAMDQTFVHDEASFFTVDVVGPDIWAGGSDGVIKGQAGSWDVYRSSIDAAEHYAYPSPFSPTHVTRQGATIHFKPLVDTYATIKIYDINLELVKIVADGVFRRGGVESDDILWDGANGDGDLAANGIYFYRIELDSGEDLWGKVVLIK